MAERVALRGRLSGLGLDLPGPVPGQAYRELQAELQAVRRKPLLLAEHG